MQKYFNFNHETALTPIQVNENTGVVTFTYQGQTTTYDSVKAFAEFYARARNVKAEDLKNWTLIEDGDQYAFVLRAGTGGSANKMVEMIGELPYGTVQILLDEYDAANAYELAAILTFDVDHRRFTDQALTQELRHILDEVVIAYTGQQPFTERHDAQNNAPHTQAFIPTESQMDIMLNNLTDVLDHFYEEHWLLLSYILGEPVTLDTITEEHKRQLFEEHISDYLDEMSNWMDVFSTEAYDDGDYDEYDNEDEYDMSVGAYVLSSILHRMFSEVQEDLKQAIPFKSSAYPWVPALQILTNQLGEDKRDLFTKALMVSGLAGRSIQVVRVRNGAGATPDSPATIDYVQLDEVPGIGHVLYHNTTFYIVDQSRARRSTEHRTMEWF